MRIARILATLAAATAAGLAFASPAVADGTEIPINQTLPQTAKGFNGGTDCADPFDKLPANKDGWHFVTTGQASFESVTLKFEKPGGGTVDVKITGTKDAPSTGAGWSGYLAKAGGTDQVKHAYLIADAGWELIEAKADLTGNTAQDFFNLSHTCAGKPDEPSSPPSTDTPGDGSPSSSAPGSGGGGSLPKTGAATGVVVIGGLALVVGGVALLAVRRRRDILES